MKFSAERFREWAKQEIAELRRLRPQFNEYKEHIELLKEVCQRADDMSEAEVAAETMDVWQGNDFPGMSWRLWTDEFLRCREAVRWFCERIE